MNLRVLYVYNSEMFLSGCITGGLWSSAHLHRVTESVKRENRNQDTYCRKNVNLTKWLSVTNFIFSLLQNRRSRDCHMSVSNISPHQCMKSALIGSLPSDLQLCKLGCSLTSPHCSKAVDIASGHRLGGRGLWVRVPVRDNILFLSTSCTLTLGPTTVLIHWVP
jgi:hypothetical protein